MNNSNNFTRCEQDFLCSLPESFNLVYRFVSNVDTLQMLQLEHHEGAICIDALYCSFDCFLVLVFLCFNTINLLDYFTFSNKYKK